MATTINQYLPQKGDNKVGCRRDDNVVGWLSAQVRSRPAVKKLVFTGGYYFQKGESQVSEMPRRHVVLHSVRFLVNSAYQ